MPDPEEGTKTIELSTPESIVRAAEEIYEADLRETFDTEDNRGKFLVIDVLTRKAYLDIHSDEALSVARQDAPTGVFHLMRIGARAASKTTRSTAHPETWLG